MIGLFLMASNKLYNYNKLEKDKEKVDNFFDTESVCSKENNYSDNDYSFVIEIPKINLKKVVYNIDSSHNNINKNITILKESPDLLILAAHSGNTSISYFKNLYKLSLEDFVYIYSDNKKKIYKVAKYYEEDKDGDIDISDNSINKKLILTTCKGSKKQLVYVAYFENSVPY